MAGREAGLGTPTARGERARGRNGAPPGPAWCDPGPRLGLGARGGQRALRTVRPLSSGRASPPGPLTQVDDLERREEAVLPGQVLPGGLGAVVLDEGEAAGAQDVVVGARHRPVEVREAELVVADGAVGHAEGGPGRQAPLQQVLRQHLRGAGLRARGGARGPGPAQQQPQRGLVGSPQGLHGRRAAAPAPQTPWGARRRGRGGWSAHAGPPRRRAHECPAGSAERARGPAGPRGGRRVVRVSGMNEVVKWALMPWCTAKNAGQGWGGVARAGMNLLGGWQRAHPSPRPRLQGNPSVGAEAQVVAPGRCPRGSG